MRRQPAYAFLPYHAALSSGQGSSRRSWHILTTIVDTAPHRAADLHIDTSHCVVREAVHALEYDPPSLYNIEMLSYLVGDRRTTNEQAVWPLDNKKSDMPFEPRTASTPGLSWHLQSAPPPCSANLGKVECEDSVLDASIWIVAGQSRVLPAYA